MATGKVNVGGGGGGKLNIYTGLTEPKNKEGIWLKTDKRHKQIINDQSLYFANDWIDPSLKPMKDLPKPFQRNAVAVVGSKIYMFYRNMFYAYDTVTDSYEQLPSMSNPDSSYEMHAHEYLGDIYIFGQSNHYSSVRMFRYDVVKQTYTQLANVPFSAKRSVTGIVGDTIYILGNDDTNNTNTHDHAYAYHIPTNKYERIVGATFPPSNSSVHGRLSATIGQYIYIFDRSGSTDNTRVLRYDTVTKTQTMYDDSVAIPKNELSYYQSAVTAVGNTIYVASKSGMYAYDVSKKSTVKYKAPHSVKDNQTLSRVGNRLYLTGYVYSNNVYPNSVFSLTAKEFPELSFVIYRTSPSYGDYYTEMVTPKKTNDGVAPFRWATGFNNAWLYYNSDLQELPSYYGDGEKWVKFKN